MSIATEITRLQTAKASLKTSIEAKGVSVSASATLDAYPALVDSIPSGGGGSVEEKVVNFIDYDGTVVASYTGEEAQALTELPSAPDHSQDEVPLTFEEWNWTLANIKSYNTNYPEVIIEVGASYHTTDGKNHFYFNITSDTDDNGVEISLNNYSSGDTVDWGDGSPIESISSATLTHVYTSIGEFHCIIDSTSTTYTFGGSSSTRRGKREKLIKAYLSNTITSFSSSSFRTCYSLQSITIPSSVTSIASYAFNACYSLQSITIPSSVTSIGDDAFNNCYSLQSITIPNKVTSIGNNAFRTCYSLQSITIPSSVTSIGNNAFNGCPSLQSITIPSSVTSIASYAFSNCYSLHSITIPSSVTNIKDNAFYACSSLRSITIPSSVTSIEASAFSTCYSLQSITIPSSVTSIAPYIFSSCPSLRSITIPSGVTSIEDFAFSSCSSLQSITIPSSVTSIGASAFYACSSLQSITIPSSVTSIGASAFYGCYSLSSVTLFPTTPPTSGTSVFSTSFLKKIYVPAESVETYKADSNWSNFASIIEAIPS